LRPDDDDAGADDGDQHDEAEQKPDPA